VWWGWQSVAFTGVSGYVIAVAWLALGLLILLFACCRCVCGSRSRASSAKRPRSNAYFWAPRVVVFLLSVVVV
jgi:hypothetical protein